MSALSGSTSTCGSGSAASPANSTASLATDPSLRLLRRHQSLRSRPLLLQPRLRRWVLSVRLLLRGRDSGLRRSTDGDLALTRRMACGHGVFPLSVLLLLQLLFLLPLLPPRLVLELSLLPLLIFLEHGFDVGYEIAGLLRVSGQGRQLYVLRALRVLCDAIWDYLFDSRLLVVFEATDVGTELL